MPYSVVIGDKEIESGKKSPRIRDDLKKNDNESSLTIGDFLTTVTNESRDRLAKTSL